MLDIKICYHYNKKLIVIIFIFIYTIYPMKLWLVSYSSHDNTTPEAEIARLGILVTAAAAHKNNKPSTLDVSGWSLPMVHAAP